MHVPEEEKYLDTEAELRDRLVSLLGGRAAEEIVFDTVTTGAANDIEQATSIARNMITRFGMSKKFGLMGLATVESQYLEGRASLTCSDVTAADIDTEVMKLLHESYKKAKKLLKENREIMDKLAAYLIEKETITGKEFMKIYRKEKGIPEPAESEEEKAGDAKSADTRTDAVQEKPADVQAGAAQEKPADTQTGTAQEKPADTQAGAVQEKPADAQTGAVQEKPANPQTGSPQNEPPRNWQPAPQNMTAEPASTPTRGLFSQVPDPDGENRDV